AVSHHPGRRRRPRQRCHCRRPPYYPADRPQVARPVRQPWVGGVGPSPLPPPARPPNGAIAADLRIPLPTVRKWRDRFASRGLEGLADEPRPGPPRTITDEQVEAAVTRTLETRPHDATHWSTRLLARALGLSQSAVVRIWH